MPRLAGGASLVIVVVGAGWLLMAQPWSHNGEAAPPKDVLALGDRFAEDRAPPEVKPLPFDGRRALKHIEDLCAIGTRVSGSEGMQRQQELVEKHFKQYADQVTWQRYEATQHSVGRPTPMANLVASWNPKMARRVIICSHYDTRPHADEERDPRRRRDPFLSANDGGSGVAVLMELAVHLKKLDLKVGVDLVLFDGEEFIFDQEGDEYFFGSKQFGKEYRKSLAANRAAPRYLAGVLLDMVAGKDAHFPVEGTSLKRAPALVREIWGLSRDVDAKSFQPDKLSRTAVFDDHVALNDAGIPTVDVIDFDYPHWHRASDLPENCSADTMEQVARVLNVWLQRLK